MNVISVFIRSKCEWLKEKGVLFFFFFKQKTAYELRISDWSSDVCSSDLSNNHRPLRSNLRPHHVVGWTAPTANRRRGRGRSRKGGTGAAPQESSLHIDRKVRARDDRKSVV